MSVGRLKNQHEGAFIYRMLLALRMPLSLLQKRYWIVIPSEVQGLGRSKVMSPYVYVHHINLNFVLARLVASLNSLHARLTHLENENSIARRRVRELEYELEQCKQDVVRERSRMMESQDAIDANARLPGPSTLRAKGKEERTREVDQSMSKYLEIVEEKKGSVILHLVAMVALSVYQHLKPLYPH